MTTTDQPASAHRAGGKAKRPGLTLLIIAGAQLMIVLDGTIVNIALPKMGEYFGKNQTDMTWALNAYTLAFGGLLLLGGRAGDLFVHNLIVDTGALATGGQSCSQRE